MSRPKVILAGHLPPLFGGIAAFCRALLDSSLGRRVDLHFVQTSPPGRPGSFGGKLRLGNVTAALSDCARFGRACLAYRPEVVHICTATGLSFLKHSLCVLLARSTGARVVLHPHCSYGRLFQGSRLWQWYCARIFRSADAVIGLSREWQDLRERLPGSAVFDLPNAIDIRPYQAGAAKRGAAGPTSVTRLLYLGYLGEMKGTYDLLQAFGMMDEGGLGRVRLDLAGEFLSDRDRRDLTERARALAREGRDCRLSPAVTGSEKLALFEQADVFAFPSYHEGMPMAILEAIASGLPVVATRVGGIPDLVVDGRNGLLIGPGSPRELADALEKMCREPDLRQEYGRESARLSLEHDIEDYVDKLVEIYKLTLGSSG